MAMQDPGFLQKLMQFLSGSGALQKAAEQGRPQVPPQMPAAMGPPGAPNPGMDMMAQAAEAAKQRAIQQKAMEVLATPKSKGKRRAAK